MDDLKNCPFCGAEAEFDYSENEVCMGRAQCTECYIGFFDEKDSAKNSWNERAKVADMSNLKYQEELERLRKCEDTLRILLEAKLLKDSGRTPPEYHEKREQGWSQAKNLFKEKICHAR